MSMKNVDNLIGEVEAAKAVPAEPVSAPEPANESEDNGADDYQPLSAKESEPEENNTSEKKTEVPRETSEESSKDEYGNEIAKAKTYTEEEVQRMIRDRLSRGNHAQSQQNNQVQEAAKSFQSDPNSEESWETQLEQFVEKTLDKVSSKQKQAQQQQYERQIQSEFEAKFNIGMGKYKDFSEVTAGKPITDSMMMAARSMENPAAFIYAASKNHPQELERIAKIADPYHQVAEIGRLEERMKKARAVSSAPKPPSKTVGDMTDKGSPKRNIDDLIRRDAASRRRR